ncbi:MAG: tetratricopeptide repeat protein [Bacteroides sp.]|nr:MAG: tetratricopeptide repeat protein [Bacteroides sp.]
MKKYLYTKFILNRFIIGINLSILGIVLIFFKKILFSIILILLGLILILVHIFVGPIGLIQKAIESNDLEYTKYLINTIKHPNLLYKPIKSMIYMIKSNININNNDFNKAINNLKLSINNGIGYDQYEGIPYLQLGSILYKQNNIQEAIINIKKAIQKGLPEDDNIVTAYLLLSSIYFHNKNIQKAKIYFYKVKSRKISSYELLYKVKEMDRIISRLGR